MTYTRIYIMSVAASGKSTFASQHGSFAGYKIVDFAEKLPGRSIITRILQFVSRAVPSMRRFLHNRKDVIAANEANYFTGVFQYFEEEPDPVVVLGRRTPDDLTKFDVPGDIRFGLVLIPENDHKRNCIKRGRRLLNSLPFFPHPTTEFSNMLAARKTIIDHVQRRGIPVFQSFADAILTLGDAEQVAGQP